MPRDALALTVIVGGQNQFVGVGSQPLELGDVLFLVGRHHVQCPEVVLDVQSQPRPRLVLVLLGNLGGAPWQVTNVPDTRLHRVPLAEVLLDGAGLGRRFNDHEDIGHGVGVLDGPGGAAFTCERQHNLSVGVKVSQGVWLYCIGRLKEHRTGTKGWCGDWKICSGSGPACHPRSEYEVFHSAQRVFSWSLRSVLQSARCGESAIHSVSHLSSAGPARVAAWGAACWPCCWPLPG